MVHILYILLYAFWYCCCCPLLEINCRFQRRATAPKPYFKSYWSCTMCLKCVIRLNGARQINHSFRFYLLNAAQRRCESFIGCLFILMVNGQYMYIWSSKRSDEHQCAFYLSDCLVDQRKGMSILRVSLFLRRSSFSFFFFVEKIMNTGVFYSENVVRIEIMLNANIVVV